MKNFKILTLILLVTTLFNCNAQNATDNAILQQSIDAHDPERKWRSVHLAIHIQEPRISNPFRMSILALNNKENSFTLKRNKDEHVASYEIDATGNSYVLLDGKQETDAAKIEKYRLNPSRNEDYKNFYSILYGLPMSLDGFVTSYGESQIVAFNKESCHKIKIELIEPIITAHWYIYISVVSKQLQGIEIIHPEDEEKGERLIFDGLMDYQGIKLPRIRHWYDFHTNEYGGSDIILKPIEE